MVSDTGWWVGARSEEDNRMTEHQQPKIWCLWRINSESRITRIKGFHGLDVRAQREFRLNSNLREPLVIKGEESMNYRQKLTLYLLLYFVVCSAVFAQVVNIPDPALDRLIRQKLRIRSDRPITQDDMRNLRGDLDAGGNIGITNITGLEYATNLTTLSFYHNPISDISPMSGMTGLTGFNLWSCQIEDLTPLRHLPNLTGAILGNNRISNLEPLSGLSNITFLDMDSNRISDISPLSTLHNLVRLELDGNQIVDYSPLANLTSLQVLWLQNNLGDDFSPLNALNLTDFRYDEVCDVVPLFSSVTDRIKGRSLPSIFQAWDGVVGLDHLSEDERNELHDLHFSQSFGLDTR